MKLQEQVPCPDCQSGGQQQQQQQVPKTTEQGEQLASPTAENHNVVPQNAPQATHKVTSNLTKDAHEAREIAHELAALEREIEDLEAGDLDAALRESALHHTLAHEAELEEIKKKSLIEAPEQQQSPEAYAEEMQRAREASQHHWSDELGMAVYSDHERAVQRARLESYRELLEGYRRLNGGLGEGGKGRRTGLRE